MPIYNKMSLVKAAKEAITEDWLKKAQEIKEIASARTIRPQTVYEKLPALPLKLMHGSPEEPEILVVKAIGERHEVVTDRGPTKVFDAEVLFSENPDIKKGKYAAWDNYTIYVDEIEKYVEEYGKDGSILGNTFVIANCGETTPKKKGNKPAHIFRIFPPP